MACHKFNAPKSGIPAIKINRKFSKYCSVWKHNRIKIKRKSQINPNATAIAVANSQTLILIFNSKNKERINMKITHDFVVVKMNVMENHNGNINEFE